MKIWTTEEEARHLGDRLSGINKAKFARDNKIRGGASMLSQHISGNRPISMDAALAYANAFKCSLAEISPRLAEQAMKAHQTTAEYNVTQGPDIRGQVPLISWVQAGAWSEIVDVFAVGDAEEWMPCPVKHGDRTFVLSVRGPSMHNPHGKPSFQDGDLIFVDPDREAINGSLVVVRLDDSNEATFKQLVIDGDQRYLQALNPAWPQQIIQINGNATICGVVIFKGEEL